MADRSEPAVVAFLFDLDGTLIDSVYQHVLAWREATQAAGIELPVWRIHRQIGMSGGLMLHGLLRETGRPLSTEDAKHIQSVHGKPMPSKRLPSVSFPAHMTSWLPWHAIAFHMPSPPADEWRTLATRSSY